MEIRWLKPEEHKEAARFILERTPWASIPKNLYGKFNKGKLVGVVSFSWVPMVEAASGESLEDMKDLMVWLDGALFGSGINTYFSFTPRKEMGKWLEKEFDGSIEGWEGKFYERRRYAEASRTERIVAGVERPECESGTGIPAETGGQGEDSSPSFSLDGSRDRPTNFHVVSAGSVDFGNPTSGNLK